MKFQGGEDYPFDKTKKGAEPEAREESVTREMPESSDATITDSGGLSAGNESCLISILPPGKFSHSESEIQLSKSEERNYRSLRGLQRATAIGPRRSGAPRTTDSSAGGDRTRQGGRRDQQRRWKRLQSGF